ncbi:MAG TPA: hypothetical protein PLW78_11185 [bacterium]|jgi:hypothetical protein|nr:hypothetical protein [bacterium]HPM47314.1 hypothetical protein [bacterium]HRQ70853.1 hypothetical protein [bacterium]
MRSEAQMIRLKRSFLLTILILTLIRLALPHENKAVLCFSNDGQLSIRETQHSLCKSSHHDPELSEIEFHDHDHCTDVEIPSLSAKINTTRILDCLAYEPFLNFKIVLQSGTLFEKTPKLQSLVDHGRQKRLNIISKTVLIC